MSRKTIPEKREAFEHAYVLSATDEKSRNNVIKWMRSWQCEGGYKNSKLQDAFVGFCLATTTHISIQEAWELAGGNPGIKATREELEASLKVLNEVCDEADESISLNEVWTALGGDASLETPSLKDVRNLLKCVRANQLVGGPARDGERGAHGLPNYSIGAIFRGDLPDCNGNVYTLSPEHQAAFDKTMSDIREIADRESVDWTTLIGKSFPVNPIDNLFMVDIPRDPNAQYTVVRTKERDGRVEGELRYEFDPTFRFQDFNVTPPSESLAERAAQFAEGIRSVRENLASPESQKKLREMTASFREGYGGKDYRALYAFIIENMCKNLPRSADIKVGPLKLYVRAGNCLYMKGERHIAVEIASIDIQPDFRGQGYAKRFFANLEKFSKVAGIKYNTVAQVHNEDFRAQLESWGFTRLDMPAAPDDFVFIKHIEG